MGRRLIPASQQRQWEQRLRDVVATVYADQRRRVQRRLDDHGIALTAATTVPAWNDDDWNSDVDGDVRDEAEDIANDVVKAAKLALLITATWGMANRASEFAGQLVSSLVQAGSAVGERLNERASVLVALEASAQKDEAAGIAYKNARAQIKAEAAMRSARSAMNDALDGGAAIFDNLSDSFINSLVMGVGQDAMSFSADDYPNATVQWNAVLDDRTRDAHADVDGQEVGIGEPFIVDGEELMYPGDPSGSDENTINCRCWLTYDGIDEGEAIDIQES